MKSPVKFWDQFRFLGNWPPTRPLGHHFAPSEQEVFKIGTLRSDDGDGSENVAEKVNSRSFNLHSDYSKSLTLSNVGEPS